MADQEENGAYDDPEVIVKGNDGGDYNEFEDGNNEEKEQKSMQEETFMLRSNFSDDPEDQWDIVKFFDANEKFKKFKPILLLQMQLQNNAASNGDGGMGGDQNQQIDQLLDTMLGAGHQNDSSSDSDDDIYNSEQDSNTFREYISTGYMPSNQSLIYDIVLSEYDFEDTKNIRKEENDEKAPFYACIEYGQCKDNNNNKEHYMSICLDNNINPKDYQRTNKLNLVIVLETSNAMNESYNNTKDNKQVIANQIVCTILDLLKEDDKLCLVTFNDSFNTLQALDDMKSTDIADLKNRVSAIQPSEDDACDFDEGYNAALGQLQEFFDVQVMAAASNDDDDDKENEQENRIIFISNYLPNSDSSLMDLMQVYSDSDENKIYTSFINIGENVPIPKLVNNVNKLRGCNINHYYLDDQQSVIQQIKQDFNSLITNPVFFNISLTLQKCKIDTTFGYFNNMKKLTKLNGTGIVKTMKTFFVNANDKGNDKEIITIRLQPEDDEVQDCNFEYTLKYEHRDGKLGEIQREVILAVNKEDGIVDDKDDSYFDCNSIRKRILLIKYIELLNEWVAKDSNDDDTNLNVSDQYKTQFEAFLKYFEYQMEQIKDDKLKQEIEILNQLVNFDETAAEKLRK